MAPSTMENHHEQEQSLGHGYTHKKFNCSYSHKKLGMRLRQRVENNKENNDTTDKQQIAKKQTLFRPYDLGNDTPRKRKISRSSCDSSDDENSQQQFSSSSSTTSSIPTVNNFQNLPQQLSVQTPTFNTAPSPQTCSSPALSPNSYAERLQRQRAALYMRYMQQFHAGNLVGATQGTIPSTLHYHPIGYPNVTAPIYNGC